MSSVVSKIVDSIAGKVVQLWAKEQAKQDKLIIELQKQVKELKVFNRSLIKTVATLVEIEKTQSDLIDHICPNCTSLSVSKIQYGLPTKEQFKNPKANVVLGGCVKIMGESKEYHCNNCCFEFNNHR